MNTDDIFSSFFPLGYQQRGPYHFSAIQTTDYDFRFFKYQFGDYFANQVVSMKILATVVPKVVAAWRVANKQLTVSSCAIFTVYKSTFYKLKIRQKNRPLLIHRSKTEIKKVQGKFFL